MGSVADGLRPAEENDILELDEWKDLRLKTVEQTVALGRSARRTRQVVANAYGDRSARTCARLWGRIQQSDSSEATGRAGALATSGSPPKRQPLPVFAGDPSHRQVGRSSGELAHVERSFGRLRQKLARHVRRTRAASESERTGHLTTKLFVEWYNEAIT
jgi:insertion element IS1 protein InsB